MVEVLFWQQLVDARLADDCVREFVFAPPRKWRFDFAFPVYWLALEIEGGVWSGGAHGRGSGIVRDIDKGNAAIAAGWRVLRATSDMVNDGRAIALVKDVLKSAQEKSA